MTPAEEQLLAAVAQAYCLSHGYKFSGFAGNGAFKAVYQALKPDGTAVAIKVYLPAAANERAAREVQALLELSKAGHPSLPTFQSLETVIHLGVSHLLSTEEFLHGGNLTALVASGGLLDRTRLIEIGRQISSALAVVADARLVHRDVKPDNIVMRSGGTAVLVDFGIVRNLTQQSLTQSWLPMGPGTPLFASPEQLNNAKAMIDHRADQFSLGVTLGVSGYGKHPFEHPGDNWDAVVARVAARHKAHPGFVQWASSRGLDPLIRMVEPWPVSRYRLPAQLIQAWMAV